MGILNITDDSFYSASRTAVADIAARARQMASAGAEMLDLGACSTRPGADFVDEKTETERITGAVHAIRQAGITLPLSIDTFRAQVARAAVAEGADIINDISGGDLDPDMFATVAELKVPYILMHMRGTPATMQTLTDYNDVTTEVVADLSRKIGRLEESGVADIIVDPGFGFAKTLHQNWRMMAQLEQFALLGRPGISRKSMLTKLLGITADEALAATAITNTLALERGAAILRVHDSAEAAQAVSIVNELNRSVCSI